MTSRQYLLGGAAILAALGIGFTAAKLTTAKPAATTEAGEEHGEEHGEAGVIVMDAAKLSAAGIAVQPVAASGLAGEILAQASVEAAPDGQAVLTARVNGSVTRIFKRVGDPVRAGETIALVESADAASIAADRSVASAKAALARQQLAREERLFGQGVSPRQDLDAARAEAAAAEAEARRARTAAGAARVSGDGRSVVVSSPISGRITAAPAQLGAFVEPNAELFRVGDPRRIQIEAAVAGADARRITPGDAAVIELGNGTTVAATVRSVTPGLDETTRSATVVLTVVDPSALQAGQLLQVRITPKLAGPAGIVVPDEAVQAVEGLSVVFVRTTNGFRAQQVTVGRRSGGRAEILQGLKPGQVVATRGAFLLKAELGKAEASHDD